MARRRIQSLAALAVLLLWGSGCVHTRIATFRDPEPAAGQFRRIAVDFQQRSLFQKEQAERIVASTLKGRTEELEMIPCSEFLLPTRSYTDQEIADLLQKNGCDGYLSVRLVDQMIRDDSDLGVSISHHAGPLDLAVGILTEGSETLSQEVEIRLIDVGSNRCVWTASTLTNASGMGKFRSAVRSMARKVASRLLESGLIR